MALADLYTQMGEEARQANLKREREVRNLYKSNLAAVEKLGVGERATIEREKERGIGQETQQMISSGLYGTTTAASLPGKWESQYAAPARLRLEDVLSREKMQAQSEYAQFIERIQNPYPDYGPLMQAYAAQGSTSMGLPSSAGLTSLPSRTGQPATPAEGDYSAGWKEPSAKQTIPTNAAQAVDSEAQKKIYADLISGEKAATYQTPTDATTGLLEAYGLIDKKPKTKASTYASTWK